MKKLFFCYNIFIFFLFVNCFNTYSNEYIKELQYRLYDLGYLPYKYNINGYLDEETENAFEKYKIINSKYFLDINNNDTIKTINYVNSIENTIDYSSNNKLIKKYQIKLKRLSYYCGDINGKYSISLENAVKAFQKKYNQIADGYISPLTRYVLDLDEHNIIPYDIVRIARYRINSNYIYGAEGPLDYDCSGFIYWCIKQIIYPIKRKGTNEWRTENNFKKIENKNELKPGDIILWEKHMGIISSLYSIIDSSSLMRGVSERNINTISDYNFICGYRIIE
ncbi:MAG: peptidoglycan-binding protein [Eubacteriales bacterium]|nr:peptidoglycan-binding protein [Eubacteriales bacterium]